MSHPLSTNHEYYFLSRWRRSKDLPVFSDPRTCIRHLSVESQYFEQDIPAEDLPVLTKFLETNTHIETINFRDHGFKEGYFRRWKMVVLAAFGNQNIVGKITMHVVLAPANVKQMLDVLGWAPQSLKSFTLGTGFFPSEKTMQDVANVVSNMTSLTHLEMRLDDEIGAVILESLATGPCSSLQSLVVRGDGSRETALKLGHFLESENSSSLKLLDLVLGNFGEAGMKSFVRGLATNTLPELTIDMTFAIDEPEVGDIFADFIVSEDCTLKKLQPHEGYIGPLQVSQTGLLEKMMGPSSKVEILQWCCCSGLSPRFSSKQLQRLNIFCVGEDTADWIQTTVESVKLCPALSALAIKFDYGTPVGDAMNIRPVLESLVVPRAGTRRGLEEFVLTGNPFFGAFNTLQDEAAVALCATLNNPACLLTKLHIGLSLKDEHFLPIFNGLQACKVLKDVMIGAAADVQPGTWLSICSIIPKLTLKALEVEVCPANVSELGEKKDEVQKALIQSLDHHKTIEEAYFYFRGDEEFHDQVKRVCFRNRVAIAAKALKNGGLPASVVPCLLQNVAQRSELHPGVQEGGSLPATIVFSLLQSCPETEIMVSAARHLLSQKASQPARPS